MVKKFYLILLFLIAASLAVVSCAHVASRSTDGSGQTFSEIKVNSIISSESSTNNYRPATAWTGTEFGVVWDDGAKLLFTRVSRDGVQIGPILHVSDSNIGDHYPSIAWNGTEYGIAWQDNRNGDYQIFFTRVDSSGNKVGSDVQVTNSSSAAHMPSIAWTGSQYGVAWHQVVTDTNQEIYFTKLNTSGTKIIDPQRISNSDKYSSHASLVWTGSGFGVAWEDYRNSYIGIYLPDIYFARISSDGTLQGSEVRVTTSELTSTTPSLAWNSANSEFGLIWSDLQGSDVYPRMYFTRISELGTKEGSDIAITAASLDNRFMSLNWTGTEYGAAWSDFRDVNWEIYFTRISATGTKEGDEVRITNAVHESLYPSMAWTGTDFGVSWEDNRDGTEQIYFVRISSQSEIEGAEINISAGGSTAEGDAIKPSLVWGNSEYGITWADNRDANYELYFTRVSSAGAKAAQEVRLTNASGDVLNTSIIRGNNEYGIAWEDDRNGNSEIFFAKVSDLNTKESSDAKISESTAAAKEPSLAWNGSEYGVAWEDNRSGNYQIYFSRISNDGAKVGSDVLVTTNPGATINMHPSIFWNGSVYGLAWEELRDPDITTICFVQLDSTGAVQGSVSRQTSSGHAHDPYLTWNSKDSKFGLSFRDKDNNQETYFKNLDNIQYLISNRVTGESQKPSAAFDSFLNDYGITWVDSRISGNGLYFSKAYFDGQKYGTDDIRVSANTISPANPKIAWNGNKHRYGIAWDEKRGTYRAVYFAQ